MRRTIKKYFLVGTIIFAATSCKESSQGGSWSLIYQQDIDGQPVAGDKQELVKAVNDGNPIRVGWSSKKGADTVEYVDHVVDVTFSTVANGVEVFGQIQPFLAQVPVLKTDSLSMTLIPVQSHWILGTNGTISSVNIDFKNDTAYAYPPSQFLYGLKWFAKTNK